MSIDVELANVAAEEREILTYGYSARLNLQTLRLDPSNSSQFIIDDFNGTRMNASNSIRPSLSDRSVNRSNAVAPVSFLLGLGFALFECGWHWGLPLALFWRQLKGVGHLFLSMRVRALSAKIRNLDQQMALFSSASQGSDVLDFLLSMAKPEPLLKQIRQVYDRNKLIPSQGELLESDPNHRLMGLAGISHRFSRALGYGYFLMTAAMFEYFPKTDYSLASSLGSLSQGQKNLAVVVPIGERGPSYVADDLIALAHTASYLARSSSSRRKINIVISVHEAAAPFYEMVYAEKFKLIKEFSFSMQVVFVTPEMKNDDGLFSFEKILRAAQDLPVVSDILTQQQGQLIMLSHVPHLYALDAQLRQLMTLLTDIAGQWISIGPRFLDHIFKAAALSAQSA